MPAVSNFETHPIVEYYNISWALEFFLINCDSILVALNETVQFIHLVIRHRIQHSSLSVSDVFPGLYWSVVCLKETGRSFELNVEGGVARLEKKYGNIQVIARNSHILSPTLYSIWINDVLKSAIVEAKKPMKQKRTLQKDKTQLRPKMLIQNQLLVQITKMILQY